MWWNIKSKFVQNIYFWSEIAKNACYHRCVKKLFCTNESCADKKTNATGDVRGRPHQTVLSSTALPLKLKLFILYRFLAHGEEEEEVDKSKDCGDSKDDEEGVLVVHRSKSNRVSRWTIWLLGVSKSVLYFEYQYYKKYQLDISTALRTVESFIVTKKSWQRKFFFLNTVPFVKKGSAMNIGVDYNELKIAPS